MLLSTLFTRGLDSKQIRCPCCDDLHVENAGPPPHSCIVNTLGPLALQLADALHKPLHRQLAQRVGLAEEA